MDKESQEILSRYMASEADYVIGVDEVGLGAWAGPLVVAGVVFRKGWGHPAVKDSKKFTNSKGKTAHEKRASVLSTYIRPQQKHENLVVVPPGAIDEIGINAALDRATEGAARACQILYPNSVVVVDGIRQNNIEGEVVVLKKADSLIPAVSAASILAKVTRDQMMIQMDKKYLGYGFGSHKGYGTAEHQQALKELGACFIHRKSYTPVAKVIWSRK